MNAEDVLALNRRLHDWMQAHGQELDSDLAPYLRKHAVSRPDELERTFSQLREQGRLLQIGVVGRVKAGKSSLLNALVFDGQNVLPRAATPMTAALTTLTYGESFGARVQFYNRDDLDDIQRNAQRFEERLDVERGRAAEQLRRRQHAAPVEDETFRSAVDQAARREVRKDVSLSAAHDQWERIRQCGVDLQALEETRTLNATDTAALARELLEYVAAEGHHMPLTKSVDVFMPLDSLHDLRIVDTPGINDPVQSREQRTSALLKECDAVFIVSPAGQFLSEQDLEVMSRITQKEGVRELVLVASQIDNQLYGSDTCLPTLQASVTRVTDDLSEHMVETLQGLAQSQPEIGRLLETVLQHTAGRVLYTSGMCHNLSVRWDRQQTWDASERKVWENLQAHYPDFFSSDNADRARANLDLLANTEALHGVLQRVRARKRDIIGQRLTGLVHSKSHALDALRTDLAGLIEQRRQEIRTADLHVLEAQQLQLDGQVTEATEALDVAVKRLVSALRDEVETELKKKLKSHCNDVKDAFTENTTDRTDREEKIRDSLAARVANWAWGGGKEEVRRRVFRLFWRPVQAAMVEFAESVSGDLRKTCEDLIEKFRGKLISELTSVSRGPLEQVSAALIIKSVRKLVDRLQIPPFELDVRELEQLRGSSDILNDDEAHAFLEQARSRFNDFEHKARRQILGLKEGIHRDLPKSFGEDFLADMHARISALQEAVGNARLTLDRLDRMARELKAA